MLQLAPGKSGSYPQGVPAVKRLIPLQCSSWNQVISFGTGTYRSWVLIWIVRPLKKQRWGIYSGRALQATPGHFLDRYFRKCAEGFSVRDIVRKITTFTQGN